MHILFIGLIFVAYTVLIVVAAPTIRTVFAEVISDVVKEKNKLVNEALAAKTKAEQDLARIEAKAEVDLADAKAEASNVIRAAQAEALKWKTTLETLTGRPIPPTTAASADTPGDTPVPPLPPAPIPPWTV